MDKDKLLFGKDTWITFNYTGHIRIKCTVHIQTKESGLERLGFFPYLLMGQFKMGTKGSLCCGISNIPEKNSPVHAM